MAPGPPRVLMRASQQYAIQGQQQFDGQQVPQQFIRGQQSSGPQLQFIRNPQWTGPQDPNAPQQHLTPMRPQHILVTTQGTPGQPTQQQILQWQQQDIQRRQLIQQQQQNQQRFQMSGGAIGTIQDKVRPTASVVSVSSSANTDSGTTVVTSSSTVRIAPPIPQTPPTISPTIALSNSQTNQPNQSNQTIASAVSVSAQVSPVYCATFNGNSTPSTTVTSPVVTPKTKTALANLLNNRLQSGNSGNSVQTKGDGGNSSQDGFPSNSSSSLSLSSSTSLSNKTGFVGSPGVVRKACLH